MPVLLTEAEKIAASTGCLVEEAEIALSSDSYGHRWIEGEIANEMSARRHKYGPSLVKVWATYAGSPDAESMDIDATINFISEGLGLDLEAPVVLAVAYELQAPAVGRFDKQAWIDGWARMSCRTLQNMKKAVADIQKRFDTDEDYFGRVYRFTFAFALVEGSRLLPLDLATAYWTLLLVPRYKIAAKWTDFAQAQGKNMSNDTWNMVFEFCRYAENDPELETYDESAAWPSVIDDFVDSIKGH